MEGDETGNWLYFRTLKSSALKTLIDCLKELFSEVPIICNAQGMTMSAVDASLACFVHFFLDAKNFESYQCPANLQFLLSINIRDLSRKIQQVKAEEELCFVMKSPQSKKLSMYRINSRSQKTVKYEIPIITINSQLPDAPKRKSKHHICLQSMDFKEICSDIKKNESETVTIECDEKHILFQSNSYIGKIKVFVSESKEEELNKANLDDDENPEARTARTPRKPMNITTRQEEKAFINQSCPYHAKGKYLVQYLNAFCKATPMSHLVKIHLDSNFALIVNYQVGELGYLNLYLARAREPDEEPEKTKPVSDESEDDVVGPSAPVHEPEKPKAKKRKTETPKKQPRKKKKEEKKKEVEKKNDEEFDELRMVCEEDAKPVEQHISEDEEEEEEDKTFDQEEMERSDDDLTIEPKDDEPEFDYDE
jgi:proliferating cell nuclear antigen